MIVLQSIIIFALIPAAIGWAAAKFSENKR